MNSHCASGQQGKHVNFNHVWTNLLSDMIAAYPKWKQNSVDQYPCIQHSYVIRAGKVVISLLLSREKERAAINYHAIRARVNVGCIQGCGISHSDFGGEESRINIPRAPLHSIPLYANVPNMPLALTAFKRTHSNTILIRNGKTCGILSVWHTTAIDSSTTSISYIQLIIRVFSWLFLCRSLCFERRTYYGDRKEHTSIVAVPVSELNFYYHTLF